MNQAPIYQNQEVLSNNPLQPVTEPTTSRQFKLPRDPRIIALAVLLVIIVLLLPLSLLAPTLRQATPPTTPTQPTTLPLSPTPTVFSSIPSDITDQFQSIDNLLNIRFSLDPPTADESIGL